MATGNQGLKVLLIGGSGFVSGALARLARSQGHQVWAVTRGVRPVPAGVHALVADRRDQAAFAEAIASANETWDLVVDCIAFTPADIQQDLEALRGRAQQLVFVSSDFVYDPVQRRFPQGEASDGFLSEGYGGLKRQAERVLEQASGDAPAWTIVRPCHIYGPGSQLGCLPTHGRDPRLITRLQAGEVLRLVGGGYFLQQPVYAPDLALTILSLAGNPATYRQTFCVAGPDVVESRKYYRIIAELLGVALHVEELPVASYLAQHPEAAPFLCHRIYDLSHLRGSGASVPATPLREGLRAQVEALQLIADGNADDR